MAYTGKLDPNRPSVQRDDLLSGRVAWDDAAPAIRSWAMLEIYNAAKTVLAVDGKDNRRNMLAKIPPQIRPIVEAEIMRIWRLPLGH